MFFVFSLINIFVRITGSCIEFIPLEFSKHLYLVTILFLFLNVMSSLVDLWCDGKVCCLIVNIHN
jgi:hypothetical protein